MAEFLTRRQIREEIFKLLYQMDFCEPEEAVDRKNLYFEQREEILEADRAVINEKLEKIKANCAVLDEEIAKFSKGWKISRMSKVDLAILRVAVYEIKLDEEIPSGVAINEAVELAKLYSGEDSPRFINGVLAAIAK